MKKPTLTEQLLLICVLIVSIVIISLGIVLPKTLLPIYEENLYNYLRQSLLLLDNPSNISNKINSEIAYIYLTNNNSFILSDNAASIIDLQDIDVVLKEITDNYGSFIYNKKKYYYVLEEVGNLKKIAITGNNYISKMKAEILKIILIVVGITFIIISLLILIWSNNLVNRIKKLKDKIDNINNDDYNHKGIYDYDDELYTLEVAIENMRIYLKEQEEYKNQMYQNISHDFKTPITVIKSHIEAIEDGIMDSHTGGEIIKEQINKLEIKVHSLLYLNKLVYLKDLEKSNEEINVKSIIESSVNKFKVQRPEVDFIVNITGKSIFKGTHDMWEAIIDNLLNNFVRYADKEIKITIKNNKMIFYNGGPHIDINILNNIFTPYKKGIRGQFGLGLSIVKKTLNLLGYEINVVNEKKGISFIIK